MKKFLFLVLILLTSCGYQPIYIGQNTNNFLYKEITTIGNNQINKKIISSLNFKKSNSNNSYDQIIIDSNKTTIATSKDSKGLIASYKTSLKTELTIKNKGETIKNKTFKNDFSYNNRNNKFELAEYQREVENNLVKLLIDEIFLYLNL